MRATDGCLASGARQGAAAVEHEGHSCIELRSNPANSAEAPPGGSSFVPPPLPALTASSWADRSEASWRAAAALAPSPATWLRSAATSSRAARSSGASSALRSSSTSASRADRLVRRWRRAAASCTAASSASAAVAAYSVCRNGQVNLEPCTTLFPYLRRPQHNDSGPQPSTGHPPSGSTPLAWLHRAPRASGRQAARGLPARPPRPPCGCPAAPPSPARAPAARPGLPLRAARPTAAPRRHRGRRPGARAAAWRWRRPGPAAVQGRHAGDLEARPRLETRASGAQTRGTAGPPSGHPAPGPCADRNLTLDASSPSRRASSACRGPAEPPGDSISGWARLACCKRQQLKSCAVYKASKP